MTSNRQVGDLIWRMVLTRTGKEMSLNWLSEKKSGKTERSQSASWTCNLTFSHLIMKKYRNISHSFIDDSVLGTGERVKN